jgi:hypothetical protein
MSALPASATELVGVRRRELLAGAGAAAIGIAIGTAPAFASVPGEAGTWIAGSVDHVENGETIWISVTTPNGPKLAAVDLQAGAEVAKDGPSALTAFAPGDEVVGVGAWNGLRFSASEFEYDYRLLQTTVTGQATSGLQTQVGPVTITSTTQARDGYAGAQKVTAKPAIRYSNGDQIVILGHRNVRTGALTAAFLGSPAA